jgi:alpha-glucosidase
MKIRFFLLSLLLSMLITQFSIADNLPKTLGNFKSITKNNSGFELVTDFGSLRAIVYSPTIVRIRISKNGEFEDFSYAVLNQPNITKFQIDESNTAIALITDSLQVIFTKNPVRVKLMNNQGAIVNEDEPAFGTTWIGEEVTTHKKLKNGERFIGLGEKTGGLDRRGQGYTNWNLDYFAYPTNADPLYQTHPFYIGIHSNLVYGIFMDNSFKSHFSFGASNDRFASFTAEDGEMNYYLIYNSSIAGILKSYSQLLGAAALPPYWSLGLQQCRYSYYPDSKVKRIAATYREKQIPADAIVLDIHYMDEYKLFTWDKKRFPNPSGMVKDLKDIGFKTVTIIDPGIKTEKGYAPYDNGVKQDVFAKYPDGQEIHGYVWPGNCAFPDFTKPKTRAWWKEEYKTLVNTGVEGFWNDMNEPASWGNRFPDNVIFDFEGRKGTHKRAHNIYGLMMARASYEATKDLLGKRPFVLTRAGYAGIHRYSAVWTGDNVSSDEHMLLGVRLLNSLSVSGVPFVGTDIGGFTGNPTKELFGRWISIGAFSPFMRIHAAIDTKDAEPWAFGERIEAICKNYIKLRYKLLPYLYSGFYENTQTGMPIQRTLAIAFPHDRRVYNGKYENQFMFGGSIMVAPLKSTEEIAKVLLPGNSDWYYLYNDSYFKGNDEIFIEAPLERLPVFVKGGSVFTTQSDIQHTGEMPSDTLAVHVYNGTEGTSYLHYEDDGSSYRHEQAGYFKRNLVHNPKTRSLSFEEVKGIEASKFKFLKIIIHGYADVKAPAKPDKFRFIDGLPHFDPVGNGTPPPSTSIYSIVVANSKSAFTVKW